jgi:nicotinamide mononucleotide transporter
VSGAWEISANIANASSIVLAGLNRAHTWWTGILACILFGWVFYQSRLYADASLQVFFVGASIVGWRQWVTGAAGASLPVRHASRRMVLLSAVVAALGTAAYGSLLHRFTDAYAPFADSAVLMLSIIGQVLLVRRLYENWWCWLAVNTIAVPLFFSRGLVLTSVLYACFWINAVIALVRWRRLIVP